MSHGRESALLYEALMRFLPGRECRAVLNPVGVRGFVTPFRKTRHYFRMRPGATERFHGTLTFPHSHGPERQMRIDKKSPSRKSGCARDLTLTEESFPQEHWQIFQRANPETRDRCEHSYSSLLRLQKESQRLRRGQGFGRVVLTAGLADGDDFFLEFSGEVIVADQDIVQPVRAVFPQVGLAVHLADARRRVAQIFEARV